MTVRQAVGSGLVLAILMTAFSCPASADPLWEWVNPLPQGFWLVDVVAGDGVLVAVGYGGTILTSLDGGDTWSVQVVSYEHDLGSVTWANGRFVASGWRWGQEWWPGSGVLLSSEDGFTWIERHRVEGATIAGLCWNGAFFLAGSVGGKSFTSLDGLIWQEHELSPGVWAIGDVVWTGTEFVALGGEEMFSSRVSSFVSSDGIEWQAYAFDEYIRPRGLAFDGEKLVAVDLGTVLLSPDGIDWEAIEVEGLKPWKIRFLNGVFIAVGNEGQVATSKDGYVWSIGRAPATRDLTDITWDGHSWVAVGEYGMIFRSIDLENWERIGRDTLDLGRQAVTDLAYGGGLFVGIGAGRVVVSPDGLNWTAWWGPEESISGLKTIEWADGTFWAVDSRGNIVTTDDGRIFDLRLRGDYSYYLFDLAHSGSVAVVVGRSRTASENAPPAIGTSVDGREWTFQTLPGEGALFGVEWTGERFVAVGMDGMVATSPDGFAWQTRSLGPDITLRGVVWSGRVLLTEGYGPDGSFFAVSRTGDQWEFVASPGQQPLGVADDLTWTGDCFVAVSGDLILTSADGLAWSVESSGTRVGLQATASDGRQLVATGGWNTIVRRTELPRCLPMPRRPEGRSVPKGSGKGALTLLPLPAVEK